MGYLITQLLFFLLVAALIGFIFGWLFRRYFAVQDQRVLVRDWESRVRVAEHTRDKYQQEARDVSTHLTSLQVKHEETNNRLTELEDELEDRDSNIVLLKHEIEEWKAKAHSLESVVRERENDLSVWKGKVPSLESSLKDRESSIVNLRSELESWETKLSRFEGTLEQRNAEISSLQEEVDRLGNLKSQLKDRDLRIAELERQGKRWQDEVSGYKQQAADRSAQVTKREEEVKVWKRKYTDLEPQIRERQQTITMLSTELEEWKKRHAILDRQLSKQSSPAPAASRKPSPAFSNASKDNLQEIHGIGPVLEGTLNNLGIYRFQQIAELSPDDITQIAEKLKTFPDRIRRDRWVDQAKELHQTHNRRG